MAETPRACFEALLTIRIADGIVRRSFQSPPPTDDEHEQYAETERARWLTRYAAAEGRVVEWTDTRHDPVRIMRGGDWIGVIERDGTRRMFAHG